MSLALPLLSATTVVLASVGGVTLLILANEAVLFLRNRKGQAPKAKSETKPAKVKKAKKQKAAKPLPQAPALYDAYENMGSSEVEAFQPIELGSDESDEETIRLSGKIRYVNEVESMRVSPVTADSIRNGRAVSEAWKQSAPIDDYVAGDVSGYYSVEGRKSLASQLRGAEDSFEYDEVDDGSLRIEQRDPSIRIVDTRIDSAAFRRRA